MSIFYLHDSVGNDVGEFEATYSSGTTQDPVVMLPNSGPSTFTLSFPVAGSAKLQTTTSPKSAVEAGTAEWVDTGHGTVSDTLQDWFVNPTAIRVVRVSGTVKFSVRGG